MADQDDNGPALAPGAGGDNSSFLNKAVNVARSLAPGALPVSQTVRATAKAFRLAPGPGGDNENFPNSD
jgi:hypothetical protein